MDKVIFTNKKLIRLDAQGNTGKKNSTASFL
ncbi:PH domain-containing protein [Maribacter sp. ACAM166]|nr:PH domain-containing protein [Maribacter sp. ACAM166]